MDIIELERWKPSETDPRRLEYVGQPTAQEVFEELKHRLEGMGYLPDEYFLLDQRWADGREIPKDADVFCTTDYGASEGVYLDVYLKWYEDGKPCTKSFITGKTLGGNGDDLDRMFLIASAITKAFHGERAAHSRYMQTGGVEEDAGGAVVHLTQKEQRVLIDALAEQRERQEGAMSQTEQLLRRMTGSITEYINTVGLRPLRMDDYDKAVLAIRDGALRTFTELYPKVPEHAHSLLVEAAGRPGPVGRKMTAMVLDGMTDVEYPSYCAACKRAIDINDPEKALFLLHWAENIVPPVEPSFYGEMAAYAYLDHRAIARSMILQCGEAQIAAAPSCLLEQFAAEKDWRTLSALVEKGISGGTSAARTLHMLTYQKSDHWMAEMLLEKRMWVDLNDYGAFHACVQNDAAGACKAMLEGGMDFDGYQQWAKTRVCIGHEATVQTLEVYWAGMKQGKQEQDAGPQMEGPGLG